MIITKIVILLPRGDGHEGAAEVRSLGLVCVVMFVVCCSVWLILCDCMFLCVIVICVLLLCDFCSLFADVCLWAS